MNGLVQLLSNLGIARLSVLGLVAAASIGFFVFLATRIATPAYGLLYSDLDLRDSGEIVQKLEGMNVPYQLAGNGTAIMVPSDQVARLRMLMAADDLPVGGSVGYEIFDKTDTFGTSSFVENIDQVRALEGELARTIASLDIVQSARVHLVLPQRQLFSRQRQVPSASIVLKLRSAARPSAQQVAAIQHLVAAAVPDLQPDRVSIVDTEGDLLARGNGNNDDGALTNSSAEEMRISYENQLAEKLQSLIERSVGPGKVRVDVHADMDFDRITTNSETFDPNGQVVRSTQTVNDKSDTATNTSTPQPVTVTNNLPNGQTAPSAARAQPQTKTSHDEETVNYEISKTVRNQIRDTGEVKRLSVAVVVDGSYIKGPNGQRKYVPRSAAEMQQLTAIVKSAIGYDAKRGDAVDVANLRFAPNEENALPNEAPQTIMGFAKSDVMRMGETLVLAIVALLVILLVVRPLINRVLDVAAAGVAGGGNLAQLSGASGGPPALPAPGGHALVASGAGAGEAGDSIDMGQVEGRVAASSVRKVAEIVEKHPEEAVAIVRSWMYQDSR